MHEDDSLDAIEVEGALPAFSLEEAADFATSEQVEFDVDSESSEEQDEVSRFVAEHVGTRRETRSYRSSDHYTSTLGWTKHDKTEQDDCVPALEMALGDSVNVRAFKLAFDSVCRGSHRTMTGSGAFLKHSNDHISSLPAHCDFVADVLLCAKRSLDRHCYALVVRMVEEDFQLWESVPKKLRKHIAERTGDLLIRRRIVSPDACAVIYWHRSRPQRFRHSSRLANLAQSSAL